jgi:PAS domain S-box-containing protein
MWMSNAEGNAPPGPEQLSRRLEALAESELRFRSLVESLPDAILVHSDDEILFANPFAVRLLKADGPDSLVGRKMLDLVSEPLRQAVKQRIEQCYATGVAAPPMESVLIACDGSLVDVETVAIPICWNGAPAIQVVARDIHIRKEAQHAAKEWQKRLELAQKSGLRIGLWDWNLTSNVVVWSDESYRQFGFTRETFSGDVSEALERIHPDDRVRVHQAIQQVLDGAPEYAAQYRIVRPDGAVLWIDAHGVLIRNGVTRIMGIGLDITNLKSNEERLRQSEEKYRDLFENAIFGIYRARRDGSLLDVNEALVEMLGYSSRRELMTRNLERDIYEDPSTRAALMTVANAGNRVEGMEVPWKRKDGKSIPVRLSGRQVLGDDGHVSHYDVLVEDISGRRELEAQLRQSQKMEALGLLAGGVAHDFNNLLGVMMANAELLLETDQTSDQQRYAEQVRGASSRAAQLTKQLLAFSRKQVLFPAVLDLNTVVKDVTTILKRLIGEDVRIEMNLSSEPTSLRADRGQLEQVLLNLATNARDAMPNGGRFTITTCNCELLEEDVERCPGAKIGRYVRLSATDTGIGMTEETRSRIFEPFFTTKPQGSGTGLGLATVYGIVKQSEGFVSVSSRPGEGTTFDFHFPRVDNAPTPGAGLVERQIDAPSGSETILLVEDEDALREVTSELLTAGGYHVLSFASGEDAIREATGYRSKVSLIISDVVLPDMRGPAIVARLQVVHPESKVLYISGYADTRTTELLVSATTSFLQKPVRRVELLQKVSTILHPQQS